MSEKQTNSHANRQVPEMVLTPVGAITNTTKEPFLKAEESGLKMRGKLDDVAKVVHEAQHGLSEITINDELGDILDGIDDYSHLVVLYWGHKVPGSGRSLRKIHPMGREDVPLMGIFSTCSPARPNPILMTVVKVCERKGNTLIVSGLDAIDGSPVLDIKPYVKSFYPQKEIIIADWMQQLLEEMAEDES